jgi:hypothetical protein
MSRSHKYFMDVPFGIFGETVGKYFPALVKKLIIGDDCYWILFLRLHVRWFVPICKSCS